MKKMFRITSLLLVAVFFLNFFPVLPGMSANNVIVIPPTPSIMPPDTSWAGSFESKEGEQNPYSITDVAVNSANTVSVEVTTGGSATLDVTILEDINNSSQIPRKVGNGFRVLNGEQETGFVDVTTTTLPAYFFVYARLVGGDGRLW